MKPISTSAAVLEAIQARPGHFTRLSLVQFLVSAGIARQARDPHHAIRCEISRHLRLGAVLAKGSPGPAELLWPANAPDQAPINLLNYS